MKKNILYIDNTYTFGGAINSLLYLIKALDNEKYNPILISGQPERTITEKIDKIFYYKVDLKLPWIHNKWYKKIIKIPIFKISYLKIIINFLRFLFWILFINIPEAIKYYTIGRTNNVSIIHLNNIIGSQLSGIIASKLLRVPCVAHLRDFEEIHAITKFYSKLITHHIAISTSIKKNLTELGVPENKISLIYDAIDLDEFSTNIKCDYLKSEFNISNKEQCIGIFGRIIEWKGIREFINAVYKVTKEIPNIRAFIVGDSSDGDVAYFNEVKKLVEKLNLEDKIVFAGFRTDINALMKLMDVIVHASITPEPFGMVIIEGMAMGKPVVATRAGGPINIIEDGKTGYLVPMKDKDALAESIKKILTDQTLKEKMGSEGIKRVKKLFSKEIYASNIETIYESILQTKN